MRGVGCESRAGVAVLAIRRDILELRAHKVMERLAHDLPTAFPGMKGFSRANLIHMLTFAETRPDDEIVQQAVGQLPWGHTLMLPTRLKDLQLRLAYAQPAIRHG